MKRLKQDLLYFSLFLISFFYTFRSLILNIQNHLLDWYDYPLVTWIIHQNLEKIKSLQFSNFFDTNVFHPHPFTLLFADTFLPQTLLALPFSYIFDNPLLVINLVFAITFFLNYIASYVFWKHFFKKPFIAFFGTMLTLFSPFVHYQLSHFQMINLWPFFFSLFFIFKHQEQAKVKNSIIAGIFLAIQFLASVYISIFLITTIIVFFITQFAERKKIVLAAKRFVIIILTFLVLDGIFIKGYLDMKNYYQVKRHIDEYIQYSAHLSDYLFTNHIKSFLYQNNYAEKWNSLNKHSLGESASFPGILLLGLSLYSLIAFKKHDSKLYIGIELTPSKTFFMIVAFIGLTFSFGPRLNFNGTYAHIPTGYSLLMKIIPLMEVIRALARWSFLFYLGLTYFALLTIAKLANSKQFIKANIILTWIFVFFILEYLPVSITTHQEEYRDADHRTLKSLCANERLSILEIPITHFDTNGNIVNGLNYISKLQMASVYHKCDIVNGYSGYDLPELQDFKNQIYISLIQYNPESFIALLKEKRVNVIKINDNKLQSEFIEPLSKIIIYLEDKKYLKKLGVNLYMVENAKLGK